jgi:hypothetical protein
MVISSSHCPISSFPSRGMEEKAMERNLNADHFINEENMDIHETNISSPINNLELVHFDLNCPAAINSHCLTKIDQERFPTVGGSFIETSCSNDSYDFLPSSNHKYVLEDILDSHIM